MAVAVKLCRKALPCKVLPGGGNGFRLDVKAQHPALFARKAAEKGRVAPVAAGGIDAEPGVSQPRGEEILHKLHGRQVGVRRRHSPLPSAAKPNFAQKASSPHRQAEEP